MLHTTLMVLQLCRLIIQGHGSIAVGVMAPDQHWHRVGVAVVSKEDTIGHEHCFSQLKQGVEDVVAKYTRTQQMV